MGAFGDDRWATVYGGRDMIFVTVGAQLPFDRLIRTVDEWAASAPKEVFAQIGKSNYQPQNIAYKPFLLPQDYKEYFEKAELIVAHAGMGTIISALELNKPLLAMPRLKKYGEHRNDHQVATAKRFLAMDYISVAFDDLELIVKLGEYDWRKIKERNKRHEVSSSLIEAIRAFVGLV